MIKVDDSLLSHTIVEEKCEQMRKYLTLSEEEANKQFLRSGTKWIENANLENLQMKEPSRALFVDDAHNLLYAGEESENLDELKVLDILSRARRHGGKTTVIFNTQMSTAFSKRLIGMCALIYKKPSPMQIEMERPELKRYSKEAYDALQGKHPIS